MTVRLATSLWITAHAKRCELFGAAAAVVARRGADQSGAVAVKVSWIGSPADPRKATALTRATMGDGRLGWIWLVGPAPEDEAMVDAKLARQAQFDPDLWVLEIEDRQGRHFLDDPIA